MAEINLNDLFTSLAPTTEAKAELLRQHYLKQKELTIDRHGKEWQEIANQASQKLRDNDYPAFTALSGEVIAMGKGPRKGGDQACCCANSGQVFAAECCHSLALHALQ